MAPKWGYWGDEPPCEHLLALRALLESSQMRVTSEHGEDPQGWVNVTCERCSRTYETVLRAPWADDPYDDDYPEEIDEPLEPYPALESERGL